MMSGSICLKGQDGVSITISPGDDADEIHIMVKNPVGVIRGAAISVARQDGGSIMYSIEHHVNRLRMEVYSDDKR